MVGCVHIVHTACYRHEWLVMVISLDESWYSGDGVELVMWLWYHVVVETCQPAAGLSPCNREYKDAFTLLPSTTCYLLKKSCQQACCKLIVKTF